MCDIHKTTPQMLDIPLLVNAWQIVKDCDIFEREKVGISIIVFHNAWRLKFGDPGGTIWRALNNLMVEWSDDEKKSPAFSVDGEFIKNATVSGLARTPSWIWVHATRNDRICETSLVHELVHISIWALKKDDGDPDHLGHEYSGWSMDHNILIQEVNATLCELGL